MLLVSTHRAVCMVVCIACAVTGIVIVSFAVPADNLTAGGTGAAIGLLAFVMLCVDWYRSRADYDTFRARNLDEPIRVLAHATQGASDGWGIVEGICMLRIQRDTAVEHSEALAKKLKHRHSKAVAPKKRPSKSKILRNAPGPLDLN